MKILKKIALRRGLERMIQPNPSFPKISRSQYYSASPYTLTVEQQLHKYGAKPRYFELKWVLCLMFGGLAAVFWKTYLQQLYTNQLDTIYRYRYHQTEISSIQLKTRMLFLKTIVYLESNYAISAFFKRQSFGKQQFQQFTEGIIRYGQYKNYVNQKDKKYDFLDIGVLQKFPYAKKVQKME